MTVKKYLAKQPPKTLRIINKLRKLIKKTLPGIKESMQYGVICYEDLYYIAALPKQVNLGFSIVGLSEADKKKFEGTGKTMRHRKIFSINFDEKEIARLIRFVKKNAKPVH